MINNLDEAIAHAEEKAKELNNTADNWKRLSDEKGLALPSDYEPCKACAKDHEQLAEMLTELKQLRERVKSLEHSAEYYRDSLFGDGIVFSLKIMRGEYNE